MRYFFAVVLFASFAVAQDGFDDYRKKGGRDDGSELCRKVFRHERG